MAASLRQPAARSAIRHSISRVAVVLRSVYHHMTTGPAKLRELAGYLSRPSGKILIIDMEVGGPVEHEPGCSTAGCKLPVGSTFHAGNPGGHTVPQTFVMQDVADAHMTITDQLPWTFFGAGYTYAIAMQ